MKFSPYKQKCKQIIAEIEEQIPFGYSLKVRALYKERGEPLPSKDTIRSVRNGRQFNIEIAEAIREVTLTGKKRKSLSKKELELAL